MPELKELLGEELHKQVTEKLGDKHKVAIVSDGSYIPKETFNQANEAKKTAEAQLVERDKQLSDLKKSAEGNEDLKKQIEQLQTDNKKKDEDYKTQLNDVALSSAVKLALTGQVHDADLVLSQLDKSKVKLGDGGKIIDGLDDQLKSLRESKAFLFVPEDPTKAPQFSGVKPVDGTPATPQDSMKAMIEKNILGG